MRFSAHSATPHHNPLTVFNYFVKFMIGIILILFFSFLFFFTHAQLIDFGFVLTVHTITQLAAEQNK